MKYTLPYWGSLILELNLSVYLNEFLDSMKKYSSPILKSCDPSNFV